MANKDLLKQAIAEAKSVREAAIANAKEALEETLTPHLKDLLAAKLQEMEELEEDLVDENMSGFSAVKEAEEEKEEEAEDESEESEDEAGHEEEESEEEEAAGDEEVDGDEDLGDLSVDEFKDMIRDIIAQELGAAEGGEEEYGDMDGGDIEGMGDEAPIEEPEAEIEDEENPDTTIDLDELLRELEEEEQQEPVMESYKAQVNAAKAETRKVRSNLNEALETIESLRKDLQEVNLLNSKLLYVNKIFKANSLTESQKVNIIAAFDKAETVKEVKLVFNTVSESIVTPKQVTSKRVNESIRKPKGMASRATGITASKPEVINEVSDAVRRMQKLAGIIK